MLNEEGFNLWADDYDQSVDLSDEMGSYPFAGYKKILNTIYNKVLTKSGKTILDIGFGTGLLASKLYEQGCDVWGQDFSQRIVELAQAKMPKAHLYQKDFSTGLAEDLKEQKYDAIIATYSLHHLTDEQKIHFLQGLFPLLKENGRIYIGDIAFETRHALENCKRQNKKEWDEDEIYFVAEELRGYFPDLTFTPYSDCSGLLELEKQNTTHKE